MPTKLSYSSLFPKINYSTIPKRFDFAVPLEDIFTEHNIHPRLKYIFQQTYELYVDCHLNIEDILYEQWSLNECLQLKNNIIYEKQPGIHLLPTSAGAYFWIIRHFLGLLPIPLIPTVTSSHTFDWKELSRKCRHFLQLQLKTVDEYNKLQSSIARFLNYLPEEHILLLNTLVVFLKKTSKIKLCKTTMVCLARYYCDAIFTRPFIPGHHNKDETMLPLLIFIITRWYHILKLLQTDYSPSISYLDSYNYFQREKSSMVNSFSQTNNFTTEFTTFQRKSYSIVKYLKDVECQTDSSEMNLITSPNEQSVISSENKLINNDENNVLDDNLSSSNKCKGDISLDKEDTSFTSFNAGLRPRKLSSFVSSLIDINEEDEIQCGKCELFNSTVINDRNNNWNDVVEEIARTVKKVEEYNYENEATPLESTDDYKSATSDLIESTFESESFDTNYISSQNSTLERLENENKEINNSSYKSFINDSNYKHRTNPNNNSLYRSFYSSDDELYNTNKENANSNNCKQEEDEHNTSTLRKLKIKFNFLRTLSPQFKRRDFFKSISSGNIKYKKIKY